MPDMLGFLGRLMIALLFIVSGANKLLDVSATQAMLTSANLPTMLAIPTGIFELGAGLMLVFGFLTRTIALLLALFSLAAAFFFHNAIADPMQATQALKNLAIAGGLLCLCGLDTARWSYDALRDRRRVDAEAADAQARAHAAELRAARAEGAATARDGVVVVDEPVVVERKRRWF